MGDEYLIEGNIVDFDHRELYIKFYYMSGLTNTVEARYEEVSVPGRSEPHVFYTDTTLDRYDVSIQLASSVSESDIRTAKNVWYEYEFLKSFQFPDYGGYLRGGPVKPPHRVILTIGNYFSMLGIIRSPVFDWKDSTVDLDGYPHIINCSFSFFAINDTPLGMAEIRRVDW